MSEFTDIAVGDLFEGRNGHPRFIRNYLDEHPGPYPVYSASIEGAFGYVDSFDYDGEYLTWVMNGYGGRVQEIGGRFSANRDRGVLVPLPDTRIPDLTYLRFAIEPVFVAAAVGRRVPGRRNDYTKLYPKTAVVQRIQVPVLPDGTLDFATMEALGSRLRRFEAAQQEVRQALENVLAARVTIESLLQGPARG